MATFDFEHQEYDKQHYPTHAALWKARLGREPTPDELRQRRMDILQGNKKTGRLAIGDVPESYGYNAEAFGNVEHKIKGWCRLPVTVVWKAAEIIILEAPKTGKTITQAYLKEQVSPGVNCSKCNVCCRRWQVLMTLLACRCSAVTVMLFMTTSSDCGQSAACKP